MSYQFWMRRFNGDPAVVGQTLQLNGRPFTVIGVAPQEFRGTTVLTGDVWVPINMVGELSPRGSALAPEGPRIRVARDGRPLKPGVSVRQASAELENIGRALEQEFPAENRGKGLRVVASSPIPGNGAPVAAFLAVLMGLVGTRARDRVRERGRRVAGPRDARGARRSPCVSRSARAEAG